MANRVITKYGAPYGLTDKEVALIRQCAVGRGHANAAEALGITKSTFDHTTRSINSKLKIRRMEAAIALLGQIGLLADVAIHHYNVGDTSGVAQRDGRQPPSQQKGKST